MSFLYHVYHSNLYRCIRFQGQRASHLQRHTLNQVSQFSQDLQQSYYADWTQMCYSKDPRGPATRSSTWNHKKSYMIDTFCVHRKERYIWQTIRKKLLIRSARWTGWGGKTSAIGDNETPTVRNPIRNSHQRSVTLSLLKNCNITMKPSLPKGHG